MGNKVHLRAQVREMANSAVTALLGQSVYDRLTAGDDAPFFVEMTVAHEGTSTGEVQGFGAMVKEWGKRVIRALVSAFNPAGRVPARIFDGVEHWHGNEGGRVAVGEIAHSRAVERNGRTEAQVVGYVFPAFPDVREAVRAGERDCCSIEADVVLSADAARVVVEDVERASAVVLGHTSRQTPGFEGSTVRALSEFGPVDAGGATPPPTDPPPTDPRPTDPPPTLSKDQLIAATKAAGLTAADLGFTVATPPTPPVVIPTPPAVVTQDGGTQVALNLSDPKFNSFLPA